MSRALSPPPRCLAERNNRRKGFSFVFFFPPVFQTEGGAPHPRAWRAAPGWGRGRARGRPRPTRKVPRCQRFGSSPSALYVGQLSPLYVRAISMPGASLASQAAGEGRGERSARCAPALLHPLHPPWGTSWRLGGKNALQAAGLLVPAGVQGLGYPPEDQLLLRSIPVGSGHRF